MRHYPWGDPDFIPTLLGVEPDGRPWAELWLGTHPGAPSHIGDRPLADWTGTLPYLLKVLAASRPLSLQVHPTEEQAVDGYARGVYVDDRPKPELLCALTPFDALCGIRPLAATDELLRRIGAAGLADRLAGDGVHATIEAVMRGHVDLAPTIAACAAATGPEAELVVDLETRYPGDPAVVITLLLNRVTLAPGEALHLTAGNLHAYVRGAGIELMSASDNVVRGGLTDKPVDVDELLRIVDPTPLAEPVMVGAAETGVYPLPEAGCRLVRVDPGVTHTSTGHELAVGLDGTTSYLAPGTAITPIAPTFTVVSP